MKRYLYLCLAVALAVRSANGNELKLDFPQPYTLIQRQSPTGGLIRVRGTIRTDAPPERIEARLADGPWQILAAHSGEGHFEGYLSAPVGQGRLEVRCVGASPVTAAVDCVGVGDLFLIAGQSNADGRGAEWTRLNSDNPFTGVKFRRGAWSRGDDPSANDTTHTNDSGSPWPIMLNTLIPAERVPMGFITAAVGSTVVRQWRRVEGATADKAWAPGGMYARALEMVRTATDGGMRVRAVLYYQGENDMTHWNGLSVMGDYSAYKSNLLAMVGHFEEDLQAPVLVGQLSNNGSDRAKNDAIRRAQQEVWREHPHALPGAVTYDIFPTDGCHFRDPARMNALAARWSAAVLAGVYKRREWTGPVLAGIRRTGARRLTLDFDRPMTARSWDGRTGDSVAGFRFTEGGRTVEGMRTMRATLDGGGVTLDFTSDLLDGLRVNYGSGADGQDGITLRAAANGLPAPMLFDVPVACASPGGE